MTMTRTLRLLTWCAAILFANSLTLTAQTTTPPPSAQTQPVETQETRPATTTIYGDTGIGLVPTGEILPAGRFSVSAQYLNQDRTEAFSDIANFPLTFGYGLADRVELFGSIRAQTRIDADRRPVDSGGTPMDYPRLTDTGWETGFGDMFVGAKANFMSQYKGQGAAVAVRGMVKIPTGDGDKGLSSGEPDFLVDFIVSREVGSFVEIAGNGGFVFRNDPDVFDLSNGFQWGVGISLPSRSPLRLIGEIRGEQYFDSTVTTSGSTSPTLPASFDVKNPVDGHVGIVFQHPSGFFAGATIGVDFSHEKRSSFGELFGDEGGDSVEGQIKIGYHPGVRRLPSAAVAAPGAGVPAPAPAAQAAANRPPTVKARCEPCTVAVGGTSTVTGDAQDPDGDPLTYRWSAPSGTFANPTDRQTVWTAPNQEGAVPVTVTVNDGRGGTASDTVTIQVGRGAGAAAARQFVFEDVYFDFDRYSLRPEATRLLDDAIKTLQANPELRLTIEGHTCNIGTAEYNLALGERRSNSVRDYLVQRGIPASRLQTVSYGEERPKFDNSREETRRLNRRGALTVRLQ